MIRSFTLSELTEVLGGVLSGSDACVSGISIDTRTLEQGNLFVAIKGPRFDGHAYVRQARDAGASAVVVQEPVEELGVAQILVRDTEKALGRLGQFNREGFHAPVVAVTGTCGKTSVKEMLASVFEQAGKVLATEGNLNNAYGVPLTLFRLEEGQQHAVIELGTSSPGEIDYITRLTEPDVSIITNAAENHLKDLLTLEGVIHEKGFILEGLKENGTAVLNLDDPSFQHWQERALKQSGRRVVSFSLDKPEADVFASEVSSTSEGTSFRLHVSQKGVESQGGCSIGFLGQTSGSERLLRSCGCISRWVGGWTLLPRGWRMLGPINEEGLVILCLTVFRSLTRVITPVQLLPWQPLISLLIVKVKPLWCWGICWTLVR